MDMNVVKKEDEKVEKYLQLAQEIRKMHKVNTEIIPVVIGALGTVPKGVGTDIANNNDNVVGVAKFHRGPPYHVSHLLVG